MTRALLLSAVALAAIAAVIVVLTPGDEDDGCGDFDSVSWASEELTPESDGLDSTNRRRVSQLDELTDCNLVEGKSRAEVYSLLGKPYAADRKSAQWTIGTGAGGDNEYVIVFFSAEDDAEAVEVSLGPNVEGG